MKGGRVMFAHQVIKDIDGVFGKTLSAFDREGASIKIKMPELNDAFFFHIGNYTDMLHLCGWKEGHKSDLTDDIKYLKLPYKKIWVDGYNSAGKEYRNEIDWCDKYGTLVVKITEKDWFLFGFYHYRVFNKWVMCPVVMTSKVTESSFLCSDAIFVNVPNYKTFTKEEMQNIFNESAGDTGHMVLVLLKLLACKNIQTEKIKAPEALNKKRRKNGKQEIFDYHVLNVVVPSKKRGYRESTEPLSHNRVHLCRGHFKEYTAEHPLFGHLIGLYWWQPHVRGQNKDGIVVKDYNVMA